MKRQATSVIPMPLTFDKEKQLWKVAGWFIESSEETEELIPSKLLAFEGYTDDETFKTQKFVSTFKSYYSSGNIQHILTYNKEGKEDGKYDSYYDEKGKLAETLVFKNGLVNGEYIIYHENGAIESKRHFIDSKIADGECPHYYDNGKIKENHSYLNNKLEGKYFEYFLMVKLKMKEPTMLAKSLVNTQSTLNQVKLELFIIKTIKISTMELTRNTAPKGS